MRVERRRLIVLLARACLGCAGLSGLWALGWARAHRRPSGLRIPDFRQGVEADPCMAIVEGDAPGQMVRAALEALGGMGRFVRPGDRVLVKPNVGFDRPPWVGATTSPEVVAEVVRMCREVGASVVVTDNPINHPVRCFTVSGVGGAVEAAGGRVVLPKDSRMGALEVGGTSVGTWAGLAEPLRWANRLIGVPTVKDHNLAGISVTMKNWYGFLAGPRNTLHPHLHEVIADLASAFVPTLVVVDATRVLVRHGPTGGRWTDVVPTNLVAAGTDQVALDSWAGSVMGRDPLQVPSLVEASRRGLGTLEWHRVPPGVLS